MENNNNKNEQTNKQTMEASNNNIINNINNDNNNNNNFCFRVSQPVFFPPRMRTVAMVVRDNSACIQMPQRAGTVGENPSRCEGGPGGDDDLRRAVR